MSASIAIKVRIGGGRVGVGATRSEGGKGGISPVGSPV